MAWTPSELVIHSLDSNSDTSLASPADVKEAELISPTVIVVSDAKLRPHQSSGAASTLSGVLSYEKKSILGNKGSAMGSLKRVLDNEIVDDPTLSVM